MNLDREVVLTRKMVLLGVLAIIAALVFMGWFVVYRLEKDRVELSEIPVSPTPAITTPDLSAPPTVEEEVFDPSLDLGIDLITALNDQDRSNDNITDSFARNNFLKQLASQVGSTGEILGGGLSTFKHYTEWYVGGYPEDGSWNENTPWCASYISWCLEQVNLSIGGMIPRYANVDNFMQHFFADTWMERGNVPTPGDLIFFGYLSDPNHMGVVIAADENYVHTIEGNVNDTIALRKYTIDDPTILGYGLLSWKN